MVTVSIACGSTWIMLLRTIPSTTIKGLLLFGKLGLGAVLTPRIENVELSLPGWPPPVCLAITPDTLPDRELVILATGAAANSDPFTELIAPVTVALFCVP